MRFRVKDLGIDVHSENVAESAERVAAICRTDGVSHPHCGTCSLVGQSICSDCTTQAFSICGGTPCPGISVTACGACSVKGASVGCSDCTTEAFSICGGTPCPHVSSDPCVTGSQDPTQQLGRLKTQLKEALAQVEQQEAEMAEAMAPQTVEEIDMLESKLRDALEALSERRAEIAGKAAPPD